MDFTNLPPQKPEILENQEKTPEIVKPKQEIKTTIKQIVAISVICGFLAGGASSLYFYSELKNYVEKTIETKLTVASKDSVASQEEAVIKAVKDNSSVVVSIIISKNVAVGQRYIFDPFGDFFGDGYSLVPEGKQTYEKKEVGGGSGLIISEDGMILTNKHVVSDDGAEYTVVTSDGKKFSAKVLAKDPVQDLAFLMIDQSKTEKKTTFSVAKLGDSNSIELGQTVIAIGNALGEYKNTISVGVISGLGRSITASGGGTVETLEDIIQTDAAINEGNSGGPLLNLKGEIVGVNTAMVLDAQNIGFTIPINKAKRDIEQIKTQGKIVYPFLGVRYVLINEEVKEEKKLTVDYGALVTKGDNGEAAVYSNSPAQKAEIKAGDIILEINGEKISANNSLSNILSKYNPNDKITLKILRGSEEKNVEVTLDQRKDEE